MNKTTIKILFIFAAIIVLAISIYHLSILASQMSDENWYQNQEKGVVIIEVISGGVSEAAGLQVGDRLIMINGDSVRSAIHAQSFLDQAKSGESLIYTIERNGRVFDVKVNLALAGLRLWVSGIVVSGILFFIFALFIVLSKPEQKYARLLALAVLLLSLYFMSIQTASNIDQRPLFYQLSALVVIASGFLAIAAFGHALLYFPEKKYTHINRFWMIYFHYILSVILIIGSLYIAMKYSFFYPRILLIIPILYMVIIEIVYRKRRNKEYLSRIKIIKFTGIIIAATLLIFFIAFQLGTPISSLESLAFVYCLFPLSCFYTTVRYRVFNIYLRIRLSLVYTTIQLSLFLAFVFSIVLVIRLLPLLEFDLPGFFLTGSSIELRNTGQLDPEKQKYIQQGYLLLFGIVSALLLYLFKNRLQLLIDKLFFQQKYDYRKALKQFGTLLSSYFTREEISQKSVEQIHDIMKVKGTALAIVKNNHFQITSARGNLESILVKEIPLPDPIINKMLNSREHLMPGELHDIESLREIEAHIYCGIPIVSGKNKLEAILFTGEKLSESAYNHDDLELLNLFADNLGTAFERARFYEDRTDKERLKRELEIARDIQLNSLPKYDPDYSGLQISSTLSAATEVGGDYYDYLEIDDNQLGILVGDVVGKGASGAIYMSKIQGFLQTLQLEKVSSELMFERLNTLIRKSFDPDFFFTALYGVFNLHSRIVNVFRLGHNGLIYYNAEKKEVKVVEPGGIAFGMSDSDQFKREMYSDKISFRTGDIFVFLTDGFLEAMNEEKQLFGEKNVCDIISRYAAEDASSIMDRLEKAITEYSVGQQQDDATGIVVKIIN
jgi:serine phosphatase RsbU (regulator of sigma subunit)